MRPSTNRRTFTAAQKKLPRPPADTRSGDLFFQPPPETIALRKAQAEAAQARAKQKDTATHGNLRQQVAAFLTSEELMSIIEFARSKGPAHLRGAISIVEVRRRHLGKLLTPQ